MKRNPKIQQLARPDRTEIYITGSLKIIIAEQFPHDLGHGQVWFDRAGWEAVKKVAVREFMDDVEGVGSEHQIQRALVEGRLEGLKEARAAVNAQIVRAEEEIRGGEA